MSFLHVFLVIFLGCLILATILAILGEGGVVVQPMSVETVGESEPLSTFLTSHLLGVVLLHVLLVHSACRVDEITLDAPHHYSVSDLVGLESDPPVRQLVLLVLRSCGGRQHVGFHVPLQGCI